MIKYSIEKLHHFQCQVCDEWFSIGDFKKRESLTCPYCDKKQIIYKDNIVPINEAWIEEYAKKSWIWRFTKHYITNRSLAKKAMTINRAHKLIVNEFPDDTDLAEMLRNLGNSYWFKIFKGEK